MTQKIFVVFRCKHAKISFWDSHREEFSTKQKSHYLLFCGFSGQFFTQLWHLDVSTAEKYRHDMTAVSVKQHKQCFWPCFGRTVVPWQLFSSQGKTQFCTPLHTRELLMHMLLWQKNAPPIQGAKTQTQWCWKGLCRPASYRQFIQVQLYLERASVM